ncbi:hypothetical protein AcV5_004679 [Taiwanofungus camphoratus]|nr:hypothetical protein AcV5_004679 [Antrodia cinnamomea]
MQGAVGNDRSLHCRGNCRTACDEWVDRPVVWAAEAHPVPDVTNTTDSPSTYLGAAIRGRPRPRSFCAFPAHAPRTYLRSLPKMVASSQLPAPGCRVRCSLAMERRLRTAPAITPVGQTGMCKRHVRGAAAF